MTKTLYDPEVEKRGIEKGIEKGDNIRALKDAENFLKLGVSEEIVSQGTGIPLEEIIELKKKLLN